MPENQDLNTLDAAAIDAAAKADSLSFLNRNGGKAREIGTAIVTAAREVAESGKALLAADAALVAAGEAVESVTKQWAEAVIRFRLRFTLADGLPDWNGSSQAYKLTVGYIAAAATTAEDPMAVNRTRNRLQKAVSRMLPAFVVQWLIDTGAVVASDADRDTALTLFDKGTKTTKDEAVNVVLQALRTQLRSASASGNKTGGKSGSRNTPKADDADDPSNAEALANRTAAEAFPVAVEADTVGLTDAIGAVRAAMLVLWNRLGRTDHRFGDGGREAFVNSAADVALLANAVGKRAAGKALPVEEAALLLKRFGPKPEAVESEAKPDPKPQPTPRKPRSRKRNGSRKPRQSRKPVAA
jgi:hypothetical protein